MKEKNTQPGTGIAMPWLHISCSIPATHTTITGADEAAAMLQHIAGPEQFVQQSIFAIYTNAWGQVLGWRLLNTGTIHAVLLDAQLLVCMGLQLQAANIILGHTMPHGQVATVQEQTLQRIHRLQQLLALADMALEDYILLSQTRWLSLQKEKLLPTPPHEPYILQ